MSDLADLHRIALDEFDRRVAALREEHLGNATPCTEWNVRELLNHVVNEDRWFVPLMHGATLEEVGDRFGGDLLGDDPKGVWTEAAAEARAVMQEDGALERTVNVSWGQISAEEYVSQMIFEHTIHGWDLARGLGIDERFDPGLVEWTYEAAKPFVAQFRRSGLFGESVEVPPDADPQTKLLALFGRHAL